MAEDIGSLYVRLGLDISELETGFVAVDRTVNENVRRLNRESDLIRLRSEVEITGLDEVADAERILQIRQESLNQQMAIQRDRVRILTAELQNLTEAHGAEAVVTQRAEIRLERERLALAQLERDLRNIGDTQEETNSRFGELADLLPPIPTKLQAIGIAAGIVASGFGAAAAAVNELLVDFRELQTQSYELNLPVNETKQFLRELKLAGGDIGDFEGYIRGITDAYVKGEYDDPEFIALRRYGAEIVDATGKLKNFADISDEVFKAWEKAEAEGNGIEFLQLTGGEAGVRDAIQLFKRLKEAREDAAKIYDANLDADQLHDLDRAFARVEEQAKELKNAIGNIFVPAAQAAAEKLFNTLHDGTEWLVENKDAIQKWGFVAEEVFSTVADKVKKGYTAVGEFVEDAMKPKNTTGNEKVDKMMSGLDWRYGSAQTPYGVDKMAKGITEATESYGVFNDAVERAEKKQQEFNGNLQSSTKSWADFRREVEKTESKLKEGDGNPLSQYGWQRAQQFRNELEELRAELDNWGNDYETALAQLDLWRDQELTQKNYVSNEERSAIEDLYSAKLDQIKRTRDDKLQEIRDNVAAADNTALQNKIAAIEEEKEAWLSAGMEEAEAESLAQKQLSDYIKGVEEELSASIEVLHQTDLEKRIAQIEREKQAWIDKGASASQAEQFAQVSIRQENQKTEDKLNQIRNSVAALYKTDLENKLDAIETEKKAWIEAGMEEVEAEELAQQKIQHIKEEYLKQQSTAEAEYLDKLAKAEEEYLSKVQAAQEEADRKNKARRDEALNVAKQEAKEFEAYLKGGYEGLQKLMYNKLIKSGVNPELLKAMTPEKLDAYENAKEKATQSFLPNWKDPYEPNMPKKPVVEIPDNLVKVPQSAENTARSLDNLATSADKAANNLSVGGEPFAPAENVGTGDSSGAVASYRQPDGSVKIENYYDSVKKAEPIINVVGDGSQNESSNYTVLEQSSQELSTAVQSTTESLGELPTIVQGVSASLSEIMGRYSELPDASAVSQSFSEMPTVIQTAIDSFRDLPITISDVTEKLSSIELPQFYDMSQSVQEVTIKINDFSNALSNFLGNVSYNGTTSEQKTPVNVNTSVQIEEAHAWDYDHIQELAEKVADILKPEIIRAIGGDSNSY